MKDFLMLKLLDRFSFLFKRLKINYPVMRKILQIKFTMDARRTTRLVNTKKTNQDKNYFLSSLWFYLIMGFLIILPFIVLADNIFVQMSFIFGMLMFLITTSVIADFSSVLLDIRDKTIILTKPVESNILSMAKFLHILRYLFLISLMLIGPGLIGILIKYWVLKGFMTALVYALIFIGETILLNLFIIVLTTFIYMIILKYYDGEKLKDIINYVQIIMSITIAVMYQFIGRIFQTNILTDISITWYHYFVIPLWFGAPFALLSESYNQHYVFLTILMLIVPVLLFIIYLRLLPTFELNLMKLNETSHKKPKIKKFCIGKFFVRNKEEYAFYQFGKQMMKSERDFKLKVYPSLGFSLIFPFIFLFNGSTGMKLSELPDSKLYLFIYFCAFLLPSVVYMLRFSSQYKGAWIYYVTPIKDKKMIYKGVLKAFIINLLTPLFLIESTVFLFLFHLHILPDLIIVFVTMLIFIVMCIKLIGIKLPFSEPIGEASNSQGILMFFMMFIIGLFALAHYLFSLLPLGIYLYLVILFVILYLLWKYGFNIKEVEK